MKDEHVKKDERDLIDQVQKDLEQVKHNLRQAIRGMRAIAKINRDDGRPRAANACMRFEGALGEALGAVQKGHADASDALLENWPDEGTIVVLGGGGGR